MKRLSIIIPAYNEAKRIEESIMRMQAYRRTWVTTYPETDLEIIYVIEKSTDDTLKLALELTSAKPGISVIGNEVQRGKGYAVRTGMVAASGDVKIFMDLDLSTDLKHVREFFELITVDGYDIVVGNRKMEASSIIRKQPIMRRMASWTFNKLVGLAGIKNITDTQCGFKAFTRATADFLFRDLMFDGFSFDVELLYKAGLVSARIKSQPVSWKDDARSKVRLVQHAAQMLRDLLILRKSISKQKMIESYHKRKLATPSISKAA
jgi:dolichyl-phosphate beta-glucosyltransferase